MSLQTLQTVALVLLWVGGVAQTVFVALWVTRPWWREWIGRALMFKSAGLAIMLDSLLVHHYVSGYSAEPYVRTGLLALVVVGIVSQPLVLGYEMWKSHDEERRLSGTGESSRRSGDPATS